MTPLLYAVPSASPRWLIADDRDSVTAAFELYRPSHLGPRAATAMFPAMHRTIGGAVLRQVGRAGADEWASVLESAATAAADVGWSWTSWAAWTGSAGARRKASVVFLRSGIPVGYCKAAESDGGREALRREASVLGRLSEWGNHEIAPRLRALVDSASSTLLLLDPLVGAKATGREPLGRAHVGLCAGLARHRGESVEDFAAGLRARCAGARLSWSVSGLRLLDHLRGAEFSHAPLYYSHGDLTPWNCLAGDELRAVDWETGGYRPFGFDLFHYVTQVEVHVRRARPAAAARRITATVDALPVRQLGAMTEPATPSPSERRLALGLYLIDTLLDVEEGRVEALDRAVTVRTEALARLLIQLDGEELSPQPVAGALSRVTS